MTAFLKPRILGGIALLANIDYSSQQPRHQMVLAVVLEVVVDEQVGEAMPEGCEVVGVLRWRRIWRL